MGLEGVSRMCPLPSNAWSCLYTQLESACLTCPEKPPANGGFTPSKAICSTALTLLTARTFSLVPHLNLLCCNFLPLGPATFPVDVMSTVLLQPLKQFFSYLGVVITWSYMYPFSLLHSQRRNVTWSYPDVRRFKKEMEEKKNKEGI